MSTIAAARDELAQLVAGLGEGVFVHRTVPEQIAPPCVVLQPADPFVFEPPAGPDGLTFAETHVISFEVHLLVQLDDEHDNEQASDQLDGMLDQLLDQLRGSAWWLEGMGAPGALVTTEWLSHGQRVTVARRVQL